MGLNVGLHVYVCVHMYLEAGVGVRFKTSWPATLLRFCKRSRALVPCVWVCWETRGEPCSRKLLASK